MTQLRHNVSLTDNLDLLSLWFKMKFSFLGIVFPHALSVIFGSWIDSLCHHLTSDENNGLESGHINVNGESLFSRASGDPRDRGEPAAETSPIILQGSLPHGPCNGNEGQGGLKLRAGSSSSMASGTVLCP